MSQTNFNWSPDHPRFLADVTGDRLADIVGFGPDGVWVGLNNGDGTFQEPKLVVVDLGFNDGWRVDRHPRFLADLTGDGCADIVGFGDAGVFVALNDGRRPQVATPLGAAVAGSAKIPTGALFGGSQTVGVNSGNGTFQAPKFALADLGFNSGWRVDRHPRFLADLTGDGRADIVGFGDAGVIVALSNGNGTFQEARFVLADMGFNSGWRVDRHPRFLADLTGDGRADIVGFGDAGVFVALNNGNGTFQAPRLVVADLGFNSGWRVDQHPRFLADLTGDSRADIVGFGDAGVFVALNNGNGTFQAPRLVVADLGFNSGWRVDRHPRFLADLTGDGRADIAGFGDAGVFVALNNGNGTFQAPQFMLADLGFNSGWRVDQHPRFLANLTGDARAEIVGFGDDGVWRALNNGKGAFPKAQFTLREFGRNSNRDLVIHEEVVRDHRKSPIKHIFVLMLENRSFDHMLGFSGITGTDIATGQPTTVDGLKGTEGNSFKGTRFTVRTGAPDVEKAGPAHEFDDVLEQLCGPDAVYPRGGAYPEVNNTGFVSSYATREGAAAAGDVMRCFGPDQLPVLNALAREFLVCDRWFSSMAGPTQPNRMFTHAATSGVFDDSPSDFETVTAETTPNVPILSDAIEGALSLFGVHSAIGGFEFAGGNIFDKLRETGVKFRIYADDPFPDVAQHDGVSIVLDIEEFEEFAGDLKDPSFDAGYVFIEPKYDALLSDYGDGNSQHPVGSVAAGERFIKATYEAIRNSPIWEKSVLVITWDEHGGYYDHVAPGSALPTGSTGRDHGFTFEQLGPRVPAVIVSPLIPKNAISHLRLEHASIIETLIEIFGLTRLEDSRVARVGVSGFGHFVTDSGPRTDAPLTLPSGLAAFAAKPRVAFRDSVSSTPDALLSEDPDGDLAMLIANVVFRHLQVEPGRRDAILARERALRTHGDLLTYAKEVDALVRAARVKAGLVKS
jgi:phospholipase C